MSLTSDLFSSNARLGRAVRNRPPLRRGETDRRAVALVQRALVAVGYPMPRSTRPDGTMDGIYGQETVRCVRRFQHDRRLAMDGVVGKKTLTALDRAVASGVEAAPAPRNLSYRVPGFRVVLAQPSSMACWATVYTMMRSWKDGTNYDIRGAVADVGASYASIYDANTGLPASQFGPFLRAAGLTWEPMANLPFADWTRLLQIHGLLWVGTLVSVNPGSRLHSRIIEGVQGDGSGSGSWMNVIDPAGGRRYRERYDRFSQKYERAFAGVSGSYFQIRHF